MYIACVNACMIQGLVNWPCCMQPVTSFYHCNCCQVKFTNTSLVDVHEQSAAFQKMILIEIRVWGISSTFL